jgi:hypothetical protein
VFDGSFINQNGAVVFLTGVPEVPGPDVGRVTGNAFRDGCVPQENGHSHVSRNLSPTIDDHISISSNACNLNVFEQATGP